VLSRPKELLTTKEYKGTEENLFLTFEKSFASFVVKLF